LIPVLFLSASQDVKDKVRGLNLGAMDYVTKPFDGYELRARVRSALRAKRFQDMLVQYALMDPLTETANRRSLDNRLEEEWQRGRRHDHPLALVMVDIDHFKSVNDDFGHHVGDVVLRHVADRLKKQCRSSDLVARFGGEEFAIILPHTTWEEAKQFAERCRCAIEAAPVEIDGQQIDITASLGLSDSEHAESVEQMIRQADDALYDAKDSGRNGVSAFVSSGSYCHV
jgi:diguanylate cyclase (GGDEF)-like protein